MKKILLTSLLALLGVIAVAAPWPDGVAIDDSGAIKIGSGIRFNWMSYQNWKPTFQNPTHFIPATGFPERTDGAFKWQGDWKLLNDISYRMTQRITAENGSLVCGWELAAPGNDRALLVLDGSLAGGEIAERNCEVDGAKITVPRDLKTFAGRKFKQAAKLVIDGTAYRVAIEGKFDVELFAGADSFRLRIFPHTVRSAEETKVDLALRITPLKGGSAAAVATAWPKLSSNHPRLAFGPAYDAVKKKNDPLTALARQRIIEEADRLLPLPLPERRMQDPMRMLYHAQEVEGDLITLAGAFALTGEHKYAERAVREMLQAADYPDWNAEKHFLDTAELTLGMALAYDAFYPVLSAAERTKISAAIRAKGLRPSLAENRGNWWVTTTNNWSQVGHSGMIAGALATSEDDPELARAIIDRAVTNLTNSMTFSYSPNGAYPEGPGYWTYATDFATVALDLLDQSFGENFGLDRVPGFSRTGDYIQGLTGPTGLLFNCADAHTYMKRDCSYAMFSLARRFNRPDYLAPWEMARLTETLRRQPGKTRQYDRLLPLLLPLLPETTPEAGAMPLSYYSGDSSAAPLASIRSDAAPEAGYFALTVGKPGRNHGHMDCGAFVYDVLGTRFAMELGAQNYAKLEAAKIDLWNPNQNSSRWTVFRYGVDSHNIPVINGARQQVDATGRITAISERELAADLSGSYRGLAAKVTRRAAWQPDRVLELEDRFSGLAPDAEVRFQLCTRADVESAPDGSLKLTADGHSVRLVNNLGAAWEVVPEKQFLKPFDQGTGKVKMVRFTVRPKQGEVAWQVRFIPETR